VNISCKYLLSLFIVFVSILSLQSQQCDYTNTSFKAGEELTYIISYNWFIVWTEVGEIKLTIKNSEYKNKATYLVTGDGKTYPSWDWFFKVRDTYKSHIDKIDMQPLFFSRDIQEGSYTQFDSYEFDLANNRAVSSRRVKDYPWDNDTISINPCVLDVLSAFIFARNMDFSKMKPGQKVPLTVILDQELYKIYFKFIDKEKLKVKHVGEFDCLKFSLLLIEGEVFEEGENMLLWVTNDKNHLPIYIESPIIIGTVKARISNIVNNRYSFTSIIK
jgi:hypothetical protein